MYAMICTRPDIAYDVSITSRYLSNPGSEHWAIVKTILKYLRRTKDMFLVYGGATELLLEAYTDADFQYDVHDRSSNSGYVITLNGEAVSWKIKKQDVIPNSTIEVEYVTVAEAGKEAFRMKKFNTELRVVSTITSPATLYCDNSGAIAQAKEPRAQEKNKHFDRHFNIIRRYDVEGKVNILKVASADNVANPLTKQMSQIQLNRHMEKVGIRYMGRWL
ncbi:secreted RxLR effector protein 161-like [Pyrus communis]|uniref:secreted RxLR effector protein 161-like n=1 Tax=Pyrus communis TaxID=23211 RepID=UPI0035C06958